MNKIMVIINPSAGNESSLLIKDLLMKHLESFFDEIKVYETEAKGDAEIFARQAALENYEAICVVGGDGTINEIFQGLFDQKYKPKLAIIPGGTGNMLAKVLGIPAIKIRAIKSFHFDQTKFVDIGICNDRVFNLFASIGPIPDAMHEVTSEEKKRFGILAYLKNSMENLANSEEYELKILTDAGSYSGNVDHLAISITNKLGHLKFTQVNESLSNGKANMIILKNKNILPRLATLTNALTGKIEEAKFVEHFIISNVEIHSLNGKDVYVDLDGEEGPCLPVDIKILREHIEVYLPSSK